MEYLARSDERVERLRGEPMVNLAHGCHLLYGAQRLPMERNPLLADQLRDIEAEIAWRWAMQATATAHVPQRGNPVARDFDGMTDAELERELRELAIGAGMAPQDSAVRELAAKRMRVIDAELARRAEERDQ